MMEYLKRLEQQSQDENLNLLDAEDESGDEDDVAHRFAGLDVGMLCRILQSAFLILIQARYLRMHCGQC